MSDIVKELLSRASDEAGIGWTPTTIIPVPARLLHHAADRIEQLEAELTIQYQDGHHDGYEKGCTISKEASERYDRIDARIEQLEAALRDIIIHCDWPDRVEKYARAALEERT